ncbi:MAG: glycine betaine ABC transporter substrate-binding protein [bacterium]
MCKLTAAIVLSLALILPVTGCKSPAPQTIKKVTVGNKNFTEQRIIGQMMKQLLENRGFKVNLVSDISTTALRQGMESGGIDICAAYTGTAWMLHLGHTYEQGIDNSELYELVKKEEKGKGFIWLDPIWNNNTYALVSWAAFAKAHDAATLSDLAALYRKNEGKIKTFVTFEFSERPDGLPALEAFYGFSVDEAFLMTGAPGASMKGLETRQCEVAIVFGTDPLITKYGWHVYPDDRAFFPPYDLTPYVRAEVLNQYPEIADILNELAAAFPGGGKPATIEIVAEGQKIWQALNAEVDIKMMKADQVARKYLVKHRLIKK